MAVKWEDEAWDEYLDWQKEDKKTLKRINKLIKSIQRDGLFSGLKKIMSLPFFNVKLIINIKEVSKRSSFMLKLSNFFLPKIKYYQ